MRKRLIKGIAVLGILIGGCAKTPVFSETAPVPEPAEVIETAVPEEPSDQVSIRFKEEHTWAQEERQFIQYSLLIENNSESDITNWSIAVDVPDGMKIEQIWNIGLSETDGEWNLSAIDYNKTIKADETLKDAGMIVSFDSGSELTVIERHFTFENGTEETTQAKETPLPTIEPLETGEAAGALHVENGHLCNEAGKAVQLKGVSTHGLAWFPEYVNKEAFQTLKEDWHVNTIRLAMYTAENGGYCSGGNREELKALIEEGVQYTKDLGMYVIIDWHILRDRDPSENEGEALKFFDEMSKKYADETHVLYEICNEPQNSPFKSVIRPYAENVIRTIRANDPDAVVLVGTNTWSQDIDEVIGNEIDDENVMYTLHFYAATHKEGLRQKLRKALDAGVPVYISECSIVDASGNGNIDSESARAWMELINQYQLSYNAWSLCNKNESSALINPSCSKTSGWSEEELSETGKWFRKEMRGE